MRVQGCVVSGDKVCESPSLCVCLGTRCFEGPGIRYEPQTLVRAHKVLLGSKAVLCVSGDKVL